MRKIMIFLATLLAYNCMYAQVTIGTNENPQKGALLDLKENNKVGRKEPNSMKGLLFPKVSLESSESLSPLFTTTEEPQITSSMGMIVYNVNENSTGIKPGLCVWNGDEWTSIEGGGSSGTAHFNLNCSSSIMVKGVLSKGKSLNPTQNVITLPVDVKKEGKYSIQAYTENGYYFLASGEFLRKGKYEVLLMGMGSPVEATTVTRLDTLDFYSNGTLLNLKEDCSDFERPALVVNDIAPDFLILKPIDVSAADLQVNQAGTGYITVRIQSPPEAAGAYYHIETDVQDGIQFEASGILTTGSQSVTLDCNGKIPTKMGILTFRITSNSTDLRNDNITAEVSVRGRAIKVKVLCDGNNDWNLLNTDGNRGGVRRLLDNKALFGPNSKYCPVEKITSTQLSGGVFNPNTDTTDIVIISYNYILDEATTEYLTEFINKGGAVIHCYENNDEGSQINLVRRILGSGIIRTNVNNNLVRLTGIAGDSIVHNGGYLSDLSNKDFGCDGGGNSYFTGVNPATTDILATTITRSHPAILKSKTQTYLLLGDGAPFMGGLKAFVDGDDDFRPLMVTADGFPALKNFGYHKYVYNAHFFVNTMIWAINRRLAIAP
ncbi:MAG: hypothetical protein FWF53_06225 [Candidatus Azobacteroides sp.]|nr:hypothetical protein [Candidatus Azobacteroides sp.]